MFVFIVPLPPESVLEEDTRTPVTRAPEPGVHTRLVQLRPTGRLEGKALISDRVT